MNLDETLAALELLNERRLHERWRYYFPVAQHETFLVSGTQYAERMLMAGNGCGKTECAAFEISRHLTGAYPSWWKGYRFDKPVTVWVGSVTGQLLRDGAQEKLFGTPGDPDALGTGFIPLDAFVKPPTTGRSSPNAIDSALVTHASGGTSRIVLKTYEQGRENWQAGTVNIVWFDEEPPQDVFSEGLTRLRGSGLTLITFTPLKGITDLVKRFIHEDSPDRLLVPMTLKEATWYTDEQRDRMVSQYPVHERQARINGLPMMGEGAVFSMLAEDLMEPAVPLAKIPIHWPRLWGIDFGIDHPFAAVLIAWDRDADRVHVLRCIRMKGAIPMQHAAAMRAIARDVPVAWPHDGAHREKGSGEPLAASYRKFGLKMLANHATHPTGGYSFEAGVLEMEAMMTEGRFKVDSTLTEWFEEYGSYHREKGLVVKKGDDLLSATRIAVMMRRAAKAVPFGQTTGRRDTSQEIATGMDAWKEDF